MADKKTDKTLTIEEKNLKLGVKGLFEKAESKENLKEKVDAYREVIEYCEGVDFAENYIKEAVEKIEELNQEIYALADKGKELDTIKETSEKSLSEIQEELDKLKAEYEIITEKYDRALELLENMKNREKNLKELYSIALAEKNGMVEASEYKELQIFTETKEKELEEMEEKVSALKKRIRTIMREGLKKSGILEKDKKDDDDDDEEMEPEDEKGDVEDKKDEKKEEVDNIFDFRNSKQVERYYEDLLESNPNIAKIKKEIIGCKTLFEAQKKYMNLSDLVEEDILPPSYRDVPEEKERINERVTPKSTLKIRDGWM